MTPRPSAPRELATLCVNTMKMLALDAIETARSGHPGACLGAADVAFVLFSRFLRFDPMAPDWPDRDRFVLSAGHASMLLYSLLHLFGYDLPLEQIRRFRQIDSITAGHPERGLAPGVEVTTGPLGQGFAHGIGLALGCKVMAARFNEPGFPLFTARVFGICGDGDLMEGISYEAASLAGHLGLGNVMYVYDSNGVSIEGPTDLAFTEDVAARFRAAGWHVLECDGHDHEAIGQAICEAVGEIERPSLVVAHTEIARGAPTLHGSHLTHGAPLGPEEVRRAKRAAGWPEDRDFYVPKEVYDFCRRVAHEGSAEREAWNGMRRRYEREYPQKAALLDRALQGEVEVEAWYERFCSVVSKGRGSATRVMSGEVIQEAYRAVPVLVGGSADLGPSNKTTIKDAGHIGRGTGLARFSGANIHFGVREHAMGAIVNGLNLFGGVRGFGATFLVFADYMKPALRLAALMGVPSIYVFTHDSIGVGEDGPTHQPVEQLWMLRTIPNMHVFRPADEYEVAAAWVHALRRRDGPTAIVLTRQPVPPLERHGVPADLEEILKGAYALQSPENDGKRVDVILMATGSEVRLAQDAASVLESQGIACRVVSAPCLELFGAQPDHYREYVIPSGVPVVSLEMGATCGWHQYTKGRGFCHGVDRFGKSAPFKVLLEHFGFSPSSVARAVVSYLESLKG